MESSASTACKCNDNYRRKQVLEEAVNAAALIYEQSLDETDRLKANLALEAYDAFRQPAYIRHLTCKYHSPRHFYGAATCAIVRIMNGDRKREAQESEANLHSEDHAVQT